VRGSWKFLPKTSLFVEVDQQFLTYLDNSPQNQALRSDSDPFRISAGVLGLITQKLSVDVQGGYGYGFYSTGPSPSTGIVGASLKYKASFVSNASLDYHHDFANSLIGSYFGLDTVGLSYSHMIRRVSLFGHLGYERMAFEGTPAMLSASGICVSGETMPCMPQLDRVDNYISFDFRFEVPIRAWLTPSAGYDLTSNVSNGYTRVESVITPVSYTKHEGWIRLAVRY
jgi:hypothetical protein